jgi:class 3 adenylate cyclase/DNA-binding CsgD family transcriptional regulator
MGTTTDARRSGVVALLFTDLVGSTGLIDRLGDDCAEELRHVHFALLRQAVADAGGQEVKNLGDGLMVVFSSVVDAAHCAVSMQRAVAEHNGEQDIAPEAALHVRIGLHAGEPYQEEGDFFGGPVVVAQRLCDQAKGGQILASEVVATLVGSRGGFRFLPVGRLPLKGLVQPLAAVAIEWERGEAARPVEHRSPRPAPRGPGLVGRAREMEVLDVERKRAGAGEFRVVLLLGDAGVGKTRLAAEVLADPGRQAVVLSARAHPLGGTTSFGLWTEAFEGHLRGRDPNVVSGLCGGFLDDLAALLRSAAAVRGAPPGGEPPRSRLLEGLAVLLANLAASGPVVILLDDVHDADASSWDALHYLARNLAGCPVLVLATARPADLAGQVAPRQILLGLEQDGLLRRLEIRPLTADAVGELAGAVLGQTPPGALVGWLDERSRGNPLFTVGLLQALLEEGADLAAPRLRRVPEALAERVTTRIGMLDDPSRSLLDLLAVVGRRVELGDVVTLTGQPFEDLSPVIDHLVRARLIAEEELGPEVTYEIAHPLERDAIYADLGAARRRTLHRTVARALLTSGYLGEAAPHFVRSADRGDTEAIDALCQAVRQAEERGLYREALAILGSLVSLISPGDERWLEVLDALVLEAEWVVDHRADVHAALAIPALRAIDSLLDRFPDPARRAAVKFRLASFLGWGTGELDDADRAAREARDLFEQAGDGQGALLAGLELAFIEGFKGNAPAELEIMAQVADAAETAGDRLVTMRAVGRGMGWGYFICGRFADSEAVLRRALEMARADGKVYFETLCLTGLARTLAFAGRAGEAFPLLEEAKRLNPAWRDSILGEWEIILRWLVGDSAAALALARELVAWNAGGLSRRRAIGIAFAALAAAVTDQMHDARRYLELAQSAYGDKGWGIWSECCRYAEAVLVWRGGDAKPAMAGLGETASRLMAMEGWPWAAFPLVDLAEVAAEQGEADVAADAVAQLRTVTERTDPELYRGLAALAEAWAELATRSPDGPARAAAAAETAVEKIPADYQLFAARARDVLGRSMASLDRSQARAALEEAAVGFDAAGAVWRRDRALEALRRMGEAGKRAAGRAAATGATTLTPRELDVARLAARGQTAPEIAQALFIGERTVESHLARIYAKLGVASKRELLQRAAELGLEPAG